MNENIKYEAVLKLETGTHTARINQLLVTPDGKTLISAGRDKTIRVWEVESKKQTGMLLGQLGAGDDGIIQRIALSPNGEYVVALAWRYPTNGGKAYDRRTDVRIYELATKKLTARFRYPGSLWDLDFSPNGKYLAVVGWRAYPKRGGYLTLYKWNTLIRGFGQIPAAVVSKGLYKDKFQNHFIVPANVRFVPADRSKLNHDRIVVANWYHHRDQQDTGGLTWYSYSDSNDLKQESHVTLDSKERIAQSSHSLAVSREFVVVTGETKEFRCYDHDGNLKKVVISESIPTAPAFSPDGNQLLTGQAYDSAIVQVKVYDTLQGMFDLKSNYYGHDSEVFATAFLQSGGGSAVSAGGDQNAIHFWDYTRVEAKRTGAIEGTGRVVHAVGVNHDQIIGIGNRDDLRDKDGRIAIQRVFDLTRLSHNPLSIYRGTLLRRAQTNELTGADKLTLEFLYQKEFANLYLRSGSNKPKRQYLTGGDADWFNLTTFGFSENLTLITANDQGRVLATPRQEDGSYISTLNRHRKWRKLVGHTASVRDHAAGKKWLVTGGDDQIVRLWYMDDVVKDTKANLEPALNLFVGTDDEWVIWSKSGYYTASKRGDRRFGYHVNQGVDKEALYFPSDRFIKTFFRPDIIQAIVEYGSEAEAGKHSFKIPGIDVSHILPPIVELIQKSPVAKAKIRFTIKVESLNPDKQPVTRVWIVQNDDFVWQARRISRDSLYSPRLTLKPGRNELKILAENNTTKAMPLIEEVMGPELKGGLRSPTSSSDRTAKGSPENQGIPPRSNGNLYLMSVGVSNYPETSGLGKLYYAHTDAIAIYNAFAASKISDEYDENAELTNRAFKTVEANILTDGKATKDAILATIRKISKKIRDKPTERDTLLVFLSGHGIAHTGGTSDTEKKPEFFFGNYDIEASKKNIKNGLSLMELGDIITSVPANLILAIDACHAGLAGGQVLDPNELTKRMFAINECGMYVLSAARGEETSGEYRSLGHGVFTRKILETLTGPEDPNHPKKWRIIRDEMSMMFLIDSVQKQVFDFTEIKGDIQIPICRTWGDLIRLVIYKK